MTIEAIITEEEKMITLEQAKSIFEDVIKQTGEKFEIFEVWEIDDDFPIYVMTVIDENGVQRMPGDPFKSIRKENGELIDWKFPLTG